MRIEIGTFISWESASGSRVGEVVNMRLDLNAAGTVVPWIVVEQPATGARVTLCATHEYMKQMKVQVVEMEEEYEMFSSDGTVIDTYTVRM